RLTEDRNTEQQVLPTTQLAAVLTKNAKKKKYWDVYYLNKGRLPQSVISSTVDLSRPTVQTILRDPFLTIDESR
ncbi:hypothetical protein CU098_009537, partial [Rhizopus stolonifer]